jgi:hypothetical protein
LRLLDTIDPKPHSSGAAVFHSPHGAASGGRYTAAGNAQRAERGQQQQQQQQQQEANSDSGGGAGMGLPAAADQVGRLTLLLLLLLLLLVNASCFLCMHRCMGMNFDACHSSKHDQK